MVEKDNGIIKSLFVVIAFSFYLTYSFFSPSMLSFICFFILLASYFILFNKQAIDLKMTKLTSWTVGLLYCGALTGIVTTGVIQFGGEYFLSLLLLSFLTDTFAYLGGKLFGKTPLAPQISPKKTLEGSAIGLIGGSLLGFLYLKSLPHTGSDMLVAIVCIAGSMFTQVGDLFESTIKRYSGVKDSGKIMPGHGGVLDRIDGLLFTGPIVYIWMLNFISA